MTKLKNAVYKQFNPHDTNKSLMNVLVCQSGQLKDQTDFNQ